MAKRQRSEEPPKGSPAWMTTFSDLMNLLLCFFVLLFSMSSVDADKWEKVVNSMNSSFSLWKGGYTSVGEGLLISAGTSQLSELGDYYNTMGEQQEETDGEQIIEKSFEEQLNEANREETEGMLDNISEQLENDEHIEIKWNSNVRELKFENALTGAVLENTITGETEEIQLDGMFVSVGEAPVTELFRDQLELDDVGYIVADETTKTSIPGVFAAGDVRTKALRQIVTAAADGAVAAYFAEDYLRNL